MATRRSGQVHNVFWSPRRRRRSGVRGQSAKGYAKDQVDMTAVFALLDKFGFEHEEYED